MNFTLITFTVVDLIWAIIFYLLFMFTATYCDSEHLKLEPIQWYFLGTVCTLISIAIPLI